jgi:type I restriction enzyme S subunit
MEDGKYIDISRLRRASKEIAAKYSRASLNDGDVLISKDGTIGRVALVPRELAGGNITQHTVRASIHPLINKFFIVRSIQSPISQQWLESEKKGVALQGVNIQDFRRLPVPLPPLSEQHEIVHRVNALFEHASAIEREVDMASRRCEGLTQAVLGKAFRGELSQTGMG